MAFLSIESPVNYSSRESRRTNKIPTEEEL